MRDKAAFVRAAPVIKVSPHVEVRHSALAVKLVFTEVTGVLDRLIACHLSVEATIEEQSREEFSFAMAHTILEGAIIFVSAGVDQLGGFPVVEAIFEVAGILVSIFVGYLFTVALHEDVILKDAVI